MKSNTKRKQETLSMKDALSGVESLKVVESKEKSHDYGIILPS
jgi:hypothetical protein